ncbi:hypothetical protein HDU97_009833 [Phlyctochytrium planicorne]|nr:hypothetical protein HDU97_009833 [Phlyctochytrium planicorne]
MFFRACLWGAGIVLLANNSHANKLLNRDADRIEKLHTPGLEIRDSNQIKPEAGPPVTALIRNGGNGYKPAGKKNGEDGGQEESPGLEKYLTWTPPPGPTFTTAIIPATDDDKATKTIKKRDVEATEGLEILNVGFTEFAEAVPAPRPMIRGFEEDPSEDVPPHTEALKHYATVTVASSAHASPYAAAPESGEAEFDEEEEEVTVEERDQPTVLDGVDPLIRLPFVVADPVNVSPTKTSTQDSSSPMGHAAPAIVRGSSTSQSQITTTTAAGVAPAVIPAVEISRGKRDFEEQATHIRIPSPDILPTFSISQNETEDSENLEKRAPPESAPTEKVDMDALTKLVSADSVRMVPPPAPLLRENGVNTAMIVSRRSEDEEFEDGENCEGMQPLSKNFEIAYQSSPAGATFEVLVLTATIVTLFSSTVLSFRQSLKADAKRSSNPKLARWSFSNGLVIFHIFTRAIQFSVIALMCLGDGPIIKYLVNAIIAPSENHLLCAVLALASYGASHAILSSPFAPRMVSFFAGRLLLRICATILSIIGSTGIVPILNIFFQSIICHYRDGAVPVRDASTGLCTVPCWTPEHWATSLFAFVCILIGIPLFVSTSSSWQTIDAQVDIKHKRWFNTSIVTATIVLAISNVWSRESPFVLSFMVTVTSSVLAVLTFTYQPINVRAAAQFNGYAFLISAVTGAVGMLANIFYAERTLWFCLLVGGWSIILASALCFSSEIRKGFFMSSSRKPTYEKAFTFEPDSGNSFDELRSRIHTAARKAKSKGTKSPVGPANVESSPSNSTKSGQGKEKVAPLAKRKVALFQYFSNSATIFSKSRLELMTIDFFEERIVAWTESGTIDEETALCVTDAIERSDAYLQLIYDRIIVCGVADKDDSRLLQAVKFAVSSGILLKNDKRPKSSTSISTNNQASSSSHESKPLLLGREESHTQVIGGEDMI